jgi:hypothetical protein
MEDNMPRIQGLVESGIKSADVQLKAVEGYVFSITLAWKGLGVGDIMATLRDSATGLSAGADEVAFIAPTANGTISREWSQGKKFDLGIFLNIGPLPSGGIVFAETTYK